MLVLKSVDIFVDFNPEFYHFLENEVSLVIDGIGVYLNIWILDYIAMLKTQWNFRCKLKALKVWLVLLDIFVVVDVIIATILSFLPFSQNLLGSMSLNQINKAVLRSIVAVSFGLIGWLYLRKLS